MRACIINEFGGRDKLMVADLAEPELMEGGVLVGIKAAGVNPADVKMRKGLYKDRIPCKFPLILGWDMAGVVESTGFGVKRFKPGDEVFAYCRRPVIQFGTYAEYITLPECYITHRPKNISFCEAAAIPLAGLTAYQALYEAGQLKKHENIIILGAAGGVGSFAVQFAKLAGARVIALGRQVNHKYLQALGADETIDYTENDFRTRIKHLLPKGADLIFDCVGQEMLTKSYACIRRGGTIVSILEREGNVQLIDEQNIQFKYIFVEPNVIQLGHIRELVESEQLKIYLNHIFPLIEVTKAHEQIETGHTRGKIVLEI